MLQDAGIEAFAGEDTSPAGIWIGGTIAGVFDAGVFVSRTESERAVALIRQHELLETLRGSGTGSGVEATCEDCGKTATFAAGKGGTVQNCPHCHAMIDVPEVDAPVDWGEGGDGEDEEQGIRPPPDEGTKAEPGG